MKLEDEIVTSPLSCSLDIRGRRVVIKVFKGAFFEDEWLFELIEDQHTFNVSETGYRCDRDAVNAALRSIVASI